jgi:hypothetical protein
METTRIGAPARARNESSQVDRRVQEIDSVAEITLCA